MARRTKRRDPIESEIELALSPGEFIRDRACFSFVSGLERVAAKIDVLTGTGPARAAGLCETFLAGCHEKAEGLDDSVVRLATGYGLNGGRDRTRTW